MIYRSENFSIDTTAFTLLRNGETQPVEPQVFDLLVYLIDNRDRVVPRDELLDKLWQGRIVSENALNARLKIARKAVGDDGKQQRIIKTLHRRGYQFVGRVVSETETGSPSEKSADQDSASDTKPSIVVLRFANHSTQEGQDYFADGMSSNIRACLSRVHALKVMSALEYGSGGQSDLQIAQAFEADYLLSGSVQREGDRVRVFVELTDAESGAIKWSERFDRRGEQVIEIQDDITTSIVATLWGGRGKIREAVRDNLAAKKTRDFNAFDCILKGIYCKERFTPKEMKEANTWFEKAIELDPQCAEAYAWRAIAMLCEIYMGCSTDADATEKSFAKARHAVEIDPGCENGYLALGWAYSSRGEHDRSLAALEKAMQINPNDSDLMVFTGEELATTHGRVDEGIELIRRGIRFNMSPPDWYFWHLGLAYFCASRLTEAIDAFERMGRQNKDTLIHLVACDANTGRLDRAADRFAELMREDPQFSPEQTGETHKHYSDEVYALLLRGLEIANGSRAPHPGLKIIEA